MIQLSNIEELTANDIPKLLEKITPVLKKRQQLHDKYSRKADSTKVMYSSDNKSTVIPFEKFITDLATGYLSGKPIYSVADTTDESKKKLLNKLLDKKQTDEDYKKSMDIIIDYVSSYNDDEKIDSMLKLQNILSLQTIIEKLGYNYIDEKNKKDSEAEDNMLNNIERMQMLKSNGANIEDTTIQEQTGNDEIKTQKTDKELMNEVEEDKNKKEKK